MGDEASRDALSRIDFIRNTRIYLAHRQALLNLWQTLSYHETAFDTLGHVEHLSNINLICRGVPPKYDPTFRQRGLSGDVIANLRQLYECATYIKPSFDSALRKIAAASNMSVRDWDGNDKVAEVGIMLCPLKMAERATEKLRSRKPIEPGPPEAWLYDVIRAGIICESEEQICAICERIQTYPSFEVVRLQNRFPSPADSGFRDVLLTVRMTIKNTQGHFLSFMCEIMVTHVDIYHYEVENNSFALVEYFRPLFLSSDSDKRTQALAILETIHEKCRDLTIDPPSPEIESAISGTISSMLEPMLHTENITILECLVDALRLMGEHEGAENAQRRLLKALVLKYGEDHLEVAAALDTLGAILRSQQKYSQSIALYEKSVYVRTRLRGDRDPLVAQALHSMAGVMCAQRKYALAIPLHEQVLLIRRQALGEEHPDVAASYNNLAGLLEVEGGAKLEQAKVYYERAIEIWRKSYGDLHPYVAASVNNLALLLDGKGRLKEARPLFEQALAIRVSIYGENHSSVAGSLNNLALCLKKLNEYDEARPLYERALAIRRWQYGERHPAVATTLNNLALLLKKQRKFDDAKPLYIQALEIRRELYGNNHGDVAASLNNLALLYDAMGQVVEAERLHEEALAIRIRVFGEEHRIVAETYHNLGLLHKKCSSYERARAMFERALQIRILYGEDTPEVRATQASIASISQYTPSRAAATVDSRLPLPRLRVLNQEHIKLALSLRETAQWLKEEGKLDECRPLLEQSLALMRQALPENDEEIAVSLMLFGASLKNVGQVTEALRLYHAATAILTELYSKRNDKVLQAMTEVAMLYKQQRNFDAAKSHLQEVLTLSQVVYGEEHECTALVLSELGRVCKLDGDYENAKKLLERALGMRMRLSGDRHPTVAHSLSDLGDLMLAMQQSSDALALYEQALNIRLQSYKGESHADVAASYRSIGNAYKEQGAWVKAKEYLEKAAHIYRTVMGDDEPLLAATLNELATVLIFVRQRGDLDAAIPIFEMALTIRLNKIGRVHPDTAQTMHDLGVVLRTYSSDKVHERALAVLYLEEALKVRKVLYAEEKDHPEAVETLSELSSLLLEEQLWDAAEPVVSELLEVRRREYPDDDSDVLIKDLRDCSLVKLRTGDVKGAKTLILEALTMCKNLHGDESLLVAEVLTELAEIREVEGKLNKAKALYEEALKIRQNLLGEAHVLVAESYESLGHVRKALGKHEKAKEHFEAALRIRKAVDGGADTFVAYLLGDIACILCLQERHEEAKPVAIENLRIRSIVSRAQKPLIAAAQEQLAEIHIALNEYSDAKPLLQEALKIRLEWESDNKSAQARLHHMLGMVLQEDGELVAALEQYESALLIHVQESDGKDTLEIATSCVEIGNLCVISGDYAIAIDHFEEALEMRIRLLGLENKHVAECMLLIAFVLRKTGEFDKARNRYEQATAILRHALGPLHLEVASCLAALSALEYQQGDYEAALGYITQVLNIRKKIVGGYHEDYINTLANQAIILCKLGKCKTALNIYQRVLKWRQFNTDPKDPCIATAMVATADLYRRLNQYENAMKMNEAAIVQLCKTVGDRDRLTRKRLAFKADMLKELGRYKESESIYRQLIATCPPATPGERTTDSPRTNYVFSLGTVLKKLGRYAEAEKMFREALDAQQADYGRGSPVVAATLSNLGVMALDQDKYDEAKELFEEALSIRKAAYNDIHPDVAASLNNLAGLNDMRGEFDLARKQHEEALLIRCQVFGPQHPAVAQSLNNLANLLMSKGKYSEAEPLLERTLSIVSEMLSDNHPDLAATMNNLAGCYEHRGEYSKAKQLYEQSLTIRQKTYGVNHLCVAQSLNNLAGMLYRQGDYERSIELYEQSMDIKTKLLGAENIEVAEGMNNLAVLHLACGKIQSAVNSQERAVKVFDKLLGESHPNTINVRGNLGISYKRLGMKGMGDRLVAEALEYFSDNQYPMTHPWVKKFATEVENYPPLKAPSEQGVEVPDASDILPPSTPADVPPPPPAPTARLDMHRTLHMRKPPAKVKTSESFNLEEGESLMLMTPGTTMSQLSPVVVDRKGRPYPETPALHRIATSSTAGSDMDDVRLSRQNSGADDSDLFDDDSQSSGSVDDNRVTVIRGVSSRSGLRGSGSNSNYSTPRHKGGPRPAPFSEMDMDSPISQKSPTRVAFEGPLFEEDEEKE